MAISFVSGASAESTSVLLGSHQKGDLLIAAVVGSSTSTTPDGWQLLFTRQLANHAIQVGYCFANSSSEVSGTWNNALLLAIAAYRGENWLGVGGVGQGAANSSVTLSYPVLSAKGTSSSGANVMHASTGLAIRIASSVLNTSTINQSPSGYTNRIDRQGASARRLCLFDSGSESSSFVGSSVTITSADSLHYHCMEIYETVIPVESSGAPKSFSPFRSRVFS